MNSRATTFLAAAFLCFTATASQAQLSAYSENFESMNAADPGVLCANSWNAYVNILSPPPTVLYGYYFCAPNGGNAASAVVTGQGGPLQGNQQMSVYSNYDDNQHASNYVEMNVYREQTVGAGDVGKTVLFQFDAKHGNWTGGSATVGAFIKTLNPAAGWAQTNFVLTPLDNAPQTWGTYSVTLLIDASLVGQILQIGFINTATHYDPTVVFYDNLLFAPDIATPAKSTSWGQLKTRYGN
jgi:hypothetical protein